MNYRVIISALAASLICLGAHAIPARPGAFNYTQPDGSVIRLELHGDEFFSWTTLAGTNQAVELDANGYWRPTTITMEQRNEAMQIRSRVNSLRIATRSSANNIMTHGERHIPVLLVEFQDQEFSVENPQEQFIALLNQSGYSENGGTGSVQDFYLENSHGQFKPIFDVYGPVTLQHEMKYYGEPVRNSQGKIIENDIQPELALYEAALLLDDSIDFSQYDVNNDGYVDMTLFYFAGYNQAEGAHENTIWPHQWSLQDSSLPEARNARFDGKAIGKYFCTSELRGNEGVNMCGVGTTCHEFAHSLGLPDFYDTDYETNGISGGLYVFSTMASGSYNNDGRTPPYFNAEERIMLGWMDEEDMKELPAGTTFIPAMKGNVAFKSFTDTDGEYFIYEYRDKTGWDEPLPEGMLVYHADKSTARTVGGVTPYNHWARWASYNMINAYGDHPCFYVVPADDQQNLYYRGKVKDMVFPGNKNITTFEPVDWESEITGLSLTDITLEKGEGVSVTASYSDFWIVSGTVRTQNGAVIPGVRVALSIEDPAGNIQMSLRHKDDAPKEISVCYTGNDGFFQFHLEELGCLDATSVRLIFSKDAYQTTSEVITPKKRGTTIEKTMLQVGEGVASEYSYYDKNATSLYVSGEPALGNSQMASILIPAEDLPADGGTVVSVMLYQAFPADAYYVIIDSGEERLLTYKVPGLGNDTRSGPVLVNLPSVSFPAGQDIHVGYAVVNMHPGDERYNGFPFITTLGGNHLYFSPLNLEKSDWFDQGDDGHDLYFAAYIANRSSEAGDIIHSFSQMGINAINDPKNGTYTAGDNFLLGVDCFEGSYPESVSWVMDGKPQNGNSVVLSEGKHTITATLKYADGSVETLELSIDVK